MRHRFEYAFLDRKVLAIERIIDQWHDVCSEQMTHFDLLSRNCAGLVFSSNSVMLSSRATVRRHCRSTY